MSYQQYPPYGQPPPQQGYYQQQQPPPGQYPPQGGYQQPYGAPPQQYGAPAPQYGAPPPQQAPYGQQAPYPPHAGYGQPAPQQYGAPPPQQAPYGQQPPYNQQPPHAGYSQPPPQQYGQAPQYGQPPPQQYGQAHPPPAAHVPPTPPSLGYGPPQPINWNADADAHALRAAMKGFGTDEKGLIRVLADKDPLQIEAIKQAYTRLHRRDLIADIKSETSGYFEKGLVAICDGPLMHDVHLLYDSMSGPGTKEAVLNDVLLGRSNADMRAIKEAYQRTYRRSLESDVKGDLSMKTERHFLIVLQATRAEDAAPVIPSEISRDVVEIYNATEAKMGTDEMKVCSILTTRNDNQIRAIAYEYQQKYARNLETVLKKEFSGHMEDALIAQLNHGMDKYMHQASLLRDAMAGMGTKDNLLVARVVRAHWDKGNMANVRGAFNQRYRSDLVKDIKSETSGDYERLMIACCGERV